jgi:Cdc6-like AAA superfamily ATPase
MLAYNLEQLLLLRQAVRSNDHTKISCLLYQDTVNDLADAREKAQRIVSPISSTNDREHNFDKLKEIAYRVWNAISPASGKGYNEWKNPYVLPPPFTTPNVDDIISHVVVGLTHVERGCRSPGGNVILHGPRGVGKTTLLQVAAVVCAVLYERAFPVYHSYDYTTGHSKRRHTLTSVSEMLQDSSIRSGVIDSESVSDQSVQDLLKRQQVNEIYPVLLIDEFTKLFFRDAPQSAEVEDLRFRGQSIMNEIHDYGKNYPNTYAMMTASVMNARKYIDVSPTYFIGYPNLNNTIYVAHQVKPIRQEQQLKDYMSARYQMHLDDEQIVQCLAATGGIGRFIAKYVEYQDMGMSVVDYEKMLHYIESSTTLFKVCSVILGENASKRDASTHAWPIEGISLEQVRSLLQADGICDPPSIEDCIETWCDQLILHQDGSQIEFLIPDMGKYLQQRMTEYDELDKARVLCQTLWGYDGGDPGKSNEMLLRKYLGRLPQVSLPCADFSVRIPGPRKKNSSPKKFKLYYAADNEEIIHSIDSLTNTLFEWKGETGLDALWLRFDYKDEISESEEEPEETSEDVPTLFIGGVQVKTGRLDSQFSDGRLNAERRKRTCSQMNATTLAGIIAKAERGLAKFVHRLYEHELVSPKVPVQIEKLLICSNKSMQDCVKNFCQRAENQPWLAQDHEIIMEDKNSHLGKQYSWEVQDGTQWMKQILPAKIAELGLPTTMHG